MKNPLTEQRRTMSGTEVLRPFLFGFMLLFVLVLTACKGPAGSNEEEGASNASNAFVDDSGATDGGPFHVGLVQLVQHPSLDAATQGFVDTLQKKLGDMVEIDRQNAAGDTSTVATIVNGFVASNKNLILANATASLQSAAAATADIPILGTAVTDYQSALELSDFTGTVGTNVSGTTDLTPFDQQVEVFLDFFDPTKKIGILSSSSEANSAFQVEEMTKRLQEKGYTVKSYTFTDGNDVSAVTSKAAAESDVLYLPTDNVAASNIEAIGNVIVDTKTPLISAFEDGAKSVGFATVAIDYYELGRLTGEMAIDILQNGKEIKEMPIASASTVIKKINEKKAVELGLKKPEGYEVVAGTEAK